MSRQLEDFLTAYLEYTKDTESPTQYHLWSGISAIASALQRKVYMNWGVETIFPNMYIVLIGPSGKCRKGVAMGIIQDIIRHVGIPYAAENITREKLIRRFKEGINTFEDPEKGVQFHCSLTAYSEELSVFLGQQDVRFLSDLTDWYNCKPEWTYDTKNMGTDRIQGICFNLMGATAPDWLVSILPREGIGGGFTARVIFIVEEEKRAWIDYPPVPDEKLRISLIKDLEQIYINCKGEMKFSPEGLEIYRKFYLSQSNGAYGVKDPKFESYNERRATHIKKLSMICTASRSSKRVIEKIDVERAIKILEAAEIKMPRVFRTLGRSRYSELTMMVFDFIVQRKVTKTSEILKKFYLDVDDYTLDIITKTLQAMRVIRVTISPQGEKVYELLKEET